MRYLPTIIHVDRDYAALLAQVVPVVALALGFEIRSMARRLRVMDGRPVAAWRRSVLLYLCTILIVLAFAEIRALAIVAGNDFLDSWTMMFILAIVVAFMAPAIDAVAEAFPPSFRPHPVRNLRDPETRLLALGQFGALTIVLLSLMLVLATVG